MCSEERMNCVFCQYAQKEKEVDFVAEYSHLFVIKCQYPVSPGHLLIISYDHTEDWFTAAHEVKVELISVIEDMKRLLDAEYAPDGYNIGANCSQAAGQTIMHFHMHLIPRYLGDVPDPRGGVRGVIPSKQSY